MKELISCLWVLFGPKSKYPDYAADDKCRLIQTLRSN